ncbi:MAG: hypothetical protein F7C35_04715, partial [Desulfurococcales archaeon]|nr:hypothetical protein [Desulfurococcales archaeon]
DSLKYDPGTGALIERTRVATFSYEENVSSSIAPDKQVIVERLENMYIKAGANVYYDYKKAVVALIGESLASAALIVSALIAALYVFAKA